MSSEKSTCVLTHISSFFFFLSRDYLQMNALADKFGEKLVILGFPCNQVQMRRSQPVIPVLSLKSVFNTVSVNHGWMLSTHVTLTSLFYSLAIKKTGMGMRFCRIWNMSDQGRVTNQSWCLWRNAWWMEKEPIRFLIGSNLLSQLRSEFAFIWNIFFFPLLPILPIFPFPFLFFAFRFHPIFFLDLFALFDIILSLICFSVSQVKFALLMDWRVAIWEPLACRWNREMAAH